MFPEDKRGYWLTQQGDRFLYSTKRRYYLINEQEQTITKIDNAECLRVLDQTYALQVDEDELEWLIDESKSKLRYFNSIDELEKYKNI